eukprot:TRINITY_DN4157_c0_g1_i3.p3 TRINITY_DN4157_c0_g1~~TRINITY_DN4157_c0_g1_i3.p3  ORF type:complete len:201 (+),score=-20.69 TRINITY_DN4157_c0_g1_i3:31-633(+)
MILNMKNYDFNATQLHLLNKCIKAHQKHKLVKRLPQVLNRRQQLLLLQEQDLIKPLTTPMFLDSKQIRQQLLISCDRLQCLQIIEFLNQWGGKCNLQVQSVPLKELALKALHQVEKKLKKCNPCFCTPIKVTPIKRLLLKPKATINCAVVAKLNGINPKRFAQSIYIKVVSTIIIQPMPLELSCSLTRPLTNWQIISVTL